MKSRRLANLALVLGLVSFVFLAGIGCPPTQQKNSVSILFTADGSAMAKAMISLMMPSEESPKQGPVDVDSIESLTVTIEEILLRRAAGSGGDSPNLVEVSNHAFDPASISVGIGATVTWLWVEDGEHTVTNNEISAASIAEGELFDETRNTTGDMVDVEFTTTGLFPYFSTVAEDIAESMAGVVEVVAGGGNGGMGDPGNRISIVPDGDGLEVDLLELQDLSVLLSTSSLPSGLYVGIELIISNPVLVLKEDEKGVEILDVMLTADGRLFISKNFTVPESGPQVITIDFGGIHLVEQDMGTFNLTPQLRVIISVDDAEVTTEGIITAIDGDIITLDIGPDSDLVDVDVSMAVITLADDTEGDVSDLAEGQEVDVDGTLQPGGLIVAEEVEIELQS